MSRRTKTLKIRVSEEELSLIQDNFSSANMSSSVRSFLLKEPNAGISKKEIEIRQQLLRELCIQGNNLNQIARACNRLTKQGYHHQAIVVLCDLGEIVESSKRIEKKYVG